MRSRLKRITLGLAGTYLALCLTACALQRSLLYHPGSPPVLDPGVLNLEWESAALETEDGEKLEAWLIEAPKARGCVLVSHGNAGSVEHRLGLAGSLVKMGFSVMLYDYRGFGNSTGDPSETGLYLDGTAAMEWLLANDWQAERIVLWGESLGGGVATELATRFDCAALVLDHSFTSAVDAGSDVFPWLPVSLLSIDRYESLSKLPDVAEPLLIIHSPDDETISYEHAERLLEASPGAVLVTTEGGHNGLGFMSRASYRKHVREFLERSVSQDE